MQILSRPETFAPSWGSITAKAAIQIGKRERLLVCLAPLLLVTAAIGIQYSGADTTLASLFFDADTGTWPLRNHWLVKGILHDSAQDAVKLFGAAYLLYITARLITGKRDRVTKIHGATFLALLAGPILVAYLKSVTHLACPWDESLFGGSVAHIRIFDTVPANTPIGHGFPAAHASSGYAFSALYFATALFAPRYRFKALAGSLLLGAAFGLAQQARGAHFLSHDLFALSLCWLSSLAVFVCFFPKEIVRFFGYNSKKTSVNAI